MCTPSLPTVRKGVIGPVVRLQLLLDAGYALAPLNLLAIISHLVMLIDGVTKAGVLLRCPATRMRSGLTKNVCVVGPKRVMQHAKSAPRSIHVAKLTLTIHFLFVVYFNIQHTVVNASFVSTTCPVGPRGRPLRRRGCSPKSPRSLRFLKRRN